MSKCPFWSTSKEKVNCYSECPMNTIINESESCPFNDIISSGPKASIVGSMNEDLFYSQDRYTNYDEDDKVINY